VLTRHLHDLYAVREWSLTASSNPMSSWAAVSPHDRA